MKRKLESNRVQYNQRGKHSKLSMVRNDPKYDNFKNINKTCNNIRKKVCLYENKISNNSVKRHE